jgi:branched-chain amino acid transport system substrate-binding protein
LRSSNALIPITPSYIHATTFGTVTGDIAFGKDGEWAKPRIVFSQFQDVQPGNVEQFRDGSRQPILWPSEYQKGSMIYPYAVATR